MIPSLQENRVRLAYHSSYRYPYIPLPTLHPDNLLLSPINMEQSKDLDLVLIGPTGYTGRLCAEHIVQHIPTDLKWALAGRSYEKIEKVAKELKQLNPDRVDPGILNATIPLNGSTNWFRASSHPA